MGFDNKDKDKDRDSRFESVYSQKVKAGKRRTYFFDVRKTKGADYYITITESTRRFEDDSYTRHKIFLYKEDFNRFVDALSDVVNHVKTELIPDYDYDEFNRRNEEYEELHAGKDSSEKDSFEKDSSEKNNSEKNSSEKNSSEKDSSEKKSTHIIEESDDDDDDDVASW